MVVGGTGPPDFWTDKVLSRWAESAGLYVSFLNLERYSTFDEAFFREALEDWGFYGPPSIKPSWLPE